MHLITLFLKRLIILHINVMVVYFCLSVNVISGTPTSTPDVINSNPVNGKCPLDDASCQKDFEGFEAIAQLHSLIDDDHDGGLDRSESEEFFRDDLKHEDGGRNFHENDDFITVYDLWKLWYHSEPYNWTVDDVIDWLTNHVELPQYTSNFREKVVDGRAVPRFASNSQLFASGLGIKNAVHKQKLSIKATDLVLFGPPKNPHNFKKDLAVVLSLMIGAGGCYFAYRQQRSAQRQMQKVMKDLTSLQTAEDALTQVQQELEKAQKEQRIIADDKQNLEKQLKDEIKLAKAEAEQLKRQRDPQDDRSELKVVEEELMKVRLALFEAERRLEENQYVPLIDLQLWLQITYEIEKKYFDAKRDAAQKQLLDAKEMWEKIRKQKGKFLGSFRVAHTTSLDETDQKIMGVRASLEEVKMDLQEKIHRWSEIEKLCHFNVASNPGIDQLNVLIKGGSNTMLDKLHCRSQVGLASLDDESCFASGSPTSIRKVIHSGKSGKMGKTGSEDSIGGGSIDHPAGNNSDPSKIVFDLGPELHTKQTSLQSDDKSNNLKSTTSMTKSRSFTVDSRSNVAPSSSIVTSQSLEGRPLHDGHHHRSSHDGHSTQRIALDALQDDENSSDSSSVTQESNDKEKKKKAGLFQRFKHKEK